VEGLACLKTIQSMQRNLNKEYKMSENYKKVIETLVIECFRQWELTKDDSAWKAEATKLVMGGEKIKAIKLVRSATGTGLKEAKDWVDNLQESLGFRWDRDQGKYVQVPIGPRG